MTMRPVLLAALLAALPGHADAVAVVCHDDGSHAVHEVVSSPDSFRLHRWTGSSPPHPPGDEVAGIFSHSSPLWASAEPDTAVVGSFRRPPELKGVVWLADGRSVELSGRVVAAALPGGGDVAAVVRLVPAGSLDTARDVAIDRSGRIVAERTLAWHDESGKYPALSVDHTLVFDRPAADADPMLQVEMRELHSLQVVGRFAFGDRHIDDVVVVRRALAFFTSSGGVFKVEDGMIESIGGDDPQMRYTSLDFDPRQRRLLVYGAGGHRVFEFDGSEVSAMLLGRPSHATRGFSHDGHVVQGEVYRMHRLRLLDAATGAVVSELLDAPNPGVTGHRLACTFADRLVTVDHDGGVIALPMTPVAAD
jgi:hypothetical protein